MTRLEFHEYLTEHLGPYPIYFQPPEKQKMKYPCVVYTLDYVQTLHADNLPYNKTKRYQLTVIDRNPDSELLEEVLKLRSASFSRSYVSDNLNHFVITVYE